jgi:hypothetical protein
MERVLVIFGISFLMIASLDAFGCSFNESLKRCSCGGGGGCFCGFGTNRLKIISNKTTIKWTRKAMMSAYKE